LRQHWTAHHRAVVRAASAVVEAEGGAHGWLVRRASSMLS
jgi:hypothetical protein